MMPGTVAQLPSLAPARPAWVPPDADGMLDFANGRYFLAGQSRAIATMLGGNFDEAAITGSGMYVDFSNANRPTPIGVFLSRLISGVAAGMTLLFEVSTASETGGFLLYLGVTPDYNDNHVAWAVATMEGAVFDQDEIFFSTDISGAGTHKIAVTFSRDVGGGSHEYAWCNDGNAAVTQTASYAAGTMTDAQLGWDGNLTSGRQMFQTYIRSITSYAAIDPADLPALTA